MPKKIGPAIADATAAFFSRTFDSPNAGYSYALDSYPTLYRQTLAEMRGRFGADELKLLLDANNGLLLTAELAGQHVALEVADSISLNAYDKKWNVDGASLVRRLRELPAFSRAVLEVWARAFWADPETYASPDRYVAALTLGAEAAGVEPAE